MSVARSSFVLASASPRRAALLRQIGLEPDQIIAPDIDESVLAGETPTAYASRMAGQKLDAALSLAGAGHFLLTADTVVACGRRILAKPADEQQALRFLALLSGRRHRVTTGFAISSPSGKQTKRLVTTIVHMRQLSQSDKQAYIASGEWQGKAGGYAIQGLAAAFIPKINGSYSNVVGLPLNEVAMGLHGLGYQRRDAGQ